MIANCEFYISSAAPFFFFLRLRLRIQGYWLWLHVRFLRRLALLVCQHSLGDGIEHFFDSLVVLAASKLQHRPDLLAFKFIPTLA